MKIELDYPVSITKNLGLTSYKITHIELRRAKINDMIGLDFNPEKQMKSFKTLISRLSGYPESIVGDIDFVDFQKITHVFNIMTGKK